MLTCSHCQRTFTQLLNEGDDTTEEEAKTLKAAKSNGQGPFCPLCRHLFMAHSFATFHKLTNVASLINRALDSLAATKRV